MSTHQKQNKPSRGDISGRQKLDAERAKREADSEEAAARLKAAGEERVAAQEVQVLDGKSAKPVPKSDAPTVLTGQSSGDATIDKVVAATKDTMGAVEVKDVGAVLAEEVEQEGVKVRAMYDIERATVGKGTEYNLAEGRRYIIPNEAARHFAERGLVEIIG